MFVSEFRRLLFILPDPIIFMKNFVDPFRI